MIVNNQIGGQQFRSIPRRPPQKYNDEDSVSSGAFRLKIGVSLAIIVSAVVLKTFIGGPDSEASRYIDKAVNGGLDYKEAVSVFGEAINGKTDVVSVFNSLTKKEMDSNKKDKNTQKSEDVKKEETIQQEKSIQEDAQTNIEKKTAENAINKNFYTTGLTQADIQSNNKQGKGIADEISLEEQEKAEVEALSFQMSDAELADDTKPVPFVIPPPSYCSYNKVNVGFKHVTPVYGIMTSPFGYRDHPVGGNASFHTGMDIAANSGTAVQCFADGTVLEASRNKVYGNYVLVQHENGIRTFYGHNSKLVVKKGQKVKLGQKISEVGTTGLSTGPHLHFEVRNGNIRLNPKFYVSLNRV